MKWFHYSFCNTLTREQAQDGYEKYVVLKSRNIPRGSITKAGMIKFEKPRAQLLFIAGEKDHIIPATLNFKNYLAYIDKDSKTRFKEFAESNHSIINMANKDEVTE